MIYPIEATMRVEGNVPVDRDNPEHEAYWSRGEILVPFVEETPGVILGHEIIDVEKGTIIKTIIEKEAFVLFAHEHDGAVLIDTVPMRLMRINPKHFKIAIKRAVQTT